MKKIFFAVVALAAMSSCAKENTVMEAPRQAIAFGDVFVDNATRADYSSSLIKQFNVYGTVSANGNTVTLFNSDGNAGATVTRGTAAYGEAWSCSESEYWIPGANYQFEAVVDGTINNGEIAYTIGANPDNDGVNDLLYAKAVVNNATADQGIVKFTFTHLLSKVKFTVKSNATGDYFHTVTGIKVSNFETGTYTIADEEWAGTTAKDVDFADIAEVKSTDTNGKSNADMLLVPNAATFNVTFTVNIYKGNKLFNSKTETIPVTIKDAEDNVVGIQKGNAYNFIIECEMDNPIKFSVEKDNGVGAWGNGGDVTIQ